MTQLLIRVVINAAALWIAATVVPGVALTDSVGGLLLVAVIFGLVNAIIKPVVALVTCPINVLTLGLFTLVINALMLMLTAYFSSGNLEISGIGSALLAGLIISIVSIILSMVFAED